jgi:hypothetical protein
MLIQLQMYTPIAFLFLKSLYDIDENYKHVIFITFWTKLIKICIGPKSYNCYKYKYVKFDNWCKQ